MGGVIKFAGENDEKVFAFSETSFVVIVCSKQQFACFLQVRGS